MFISFMTGAILIYFFHIFQSAIVHRCYITSIALFSAWLGSKTKDKQTSIFWKCLSVWVIYSNIFFDMHTHWHGYMRVARHVLLCIVPFLVMYSSMDKMIYQLYFWSIVVIVPDMSSNIYGNAIMSEIKIFICCLLIMIRFKKRTSIEADIMENYLWVFFIHDSLTWLAAIQFYYDLRAPRKKIAYQYKEDDNTEDSIMEKQPSKRVINESDLRGFFNKT